jgi:hypothetical protein
LPFALQNLFQRFSRCAKIRSGIGKRRTVELFSDDKVVEG